MVNEKVQVNTKYPGILRSMYTTMLRIRTFEEKIVEVYGAQEMKCPVHLCIGQEAIAAGVMQNLQGCDFVASNHRGHGHAIAKGISMKSLMAEFYGRVDGCSGGKGGSMHIIDNDLGVIGTSAIVGGGIPIGVGYGLASKIRGDESITAVFFGDGAADEGVLYESINFAALKRLPVIFVCENNFYATNSHHSQRHPTGKIGDTASSYGIPGYSIDGNDVVEVFQAAQSAAGRARRGLGPSIIEATTYRWKGHVGPSADFESGCREENELLEWMERCPIKQFTRVILDEGLMTEEEMLELEESIKTEVDEAERFGAESPYPDESQLYKDLYA